MSRTGLCDECSEKMFTRDVGRCEKCGGLTSSGAFTLCVGCAKKAGVCQACRKPDEDDVHPNIVRGLD